MSRKNKIRAIVAAVLTAFGTIITAVTIHYLENRLDEKPPFHELNETLKEGWGLE